MDPNELARVVNIAVVVDRHVLLVRRSATDSLPGMWEIPGGAVEPDETFAHAAARELAEETGIRSDRLGELLHLTGPAPRGFRQARIEVGLFLLRLDQRPVVVLTPSEHSECGWCEPGELARLPMMDINRSLAILACASLRTAPSR